VEIHYRCTEIEPYEEIEEFSKHRLLRAVA